MAWNNDKCIALIEAVRANEVLWKPTHPEYFNKLREYDAWQEVAKEMNIPVDQCQKKMDTLRGSYRREKTRAKKSVGTGKGANEIYTSKGFAFEALKFLDDTTRPRKTMTSLSSALDESESTVDEDETDLLPADELPEDAEQSYTPTQEIERASTSREETEPATTTQKKLFKSPQRKQISRMKHTRSNDNIEKAMGYLKEVTEAAKEAKDECSSFGEFITQKLRKLSPRLRNLAQHRIHQVLFEIEMGVEPLPPSSLYGSSHSSGCSSRSSDKIGTSGLSPINYDQSLSPAPRLHSDKNGSFHQHEYSTLPRQNNPTQAGNEQIPPEIPNSVTTLFSSFLPEEI